MRIRCWLKLCPMVQVEDDTHIWGECLKCGRRAGIVSRAAVRAYYDAQERHEEFLARQAAILASKPSSRP